MKRQRDAEPYEEQLMELIATSLSDVPVLRVAGDVDHCTSSELEVAVQETLGEGGYHLLLDLAECPYIDSGGLGVILTTLRKVRGKGWLGVIGCSRDLSRLFLISGLNTDPDFRLFATTAQASAALAEEGT